MEKLRIYYRFKGNGIIFGSAASDYDLLKKNFPTSQPAKSVFVEYDIKSDFRKYHAQLENYIFPALAGFQKAEDLKNIKKVDFILTPEFTVTYTINNHEPQSQSLHR
jgi:hypothetical protein